MSISKFFLIGSLILLSSMMLLPHQLSASDKIKAIEINQASFSCIRDLTKVRGLYVGNLLGNLNDTIKVAKSVDGGVYPTGTIIQLVPTEVMVKHPKGFSAATNDWEFFELEISKTGTAIKTRGFANIVNRFGGNCLGCHMKAKPQWDLICETTHGCDPLPFTKSMLSFIQKTDPRCETNARLNDDEKQAAVQLQKMRTAIKAKNKSTKK